MTNSATAREQSSSSKKSSKHVHFDMDFFSDNQLNTGFGISAINIAKSTNYMYEWNSVNVGVHVYIALLIFSLMNVQLPQLVEKNPGIAIEALLKLTNSSSSQLAE